MPEDNYKVPLPVPGFDIAFREAEERLKKLHEWFYSASQEEQVAGETIMSILMSK